MREKKIQRELAAFLHGRVCIVGVGNRNRGDDGAGPCVIDSRRMGTPGVWVDAGMTLENYLEPIARSNPDAVLIVDAVDFGGFPGECRIMDAAAMEMVVLSTHAGSLDLLSQYLAARTGARVQVLAIQPNRIASQEGLSPSVESSVRRLARMMSDLLVQHQLT